MELETLRDQVTASLCLRSKDQLIEICKVLKCSETEKEGSFKDMSRRVLMKVIEHKLDDVERDYKPDDAIQYVHELLSAIREIGPKGDASEWRDFSRASEMKDKCEDLQGEIRALEEKLKMADAAPVLLHPAQGRIPEVTIRRDFRISGQIGEGGQRDRLSYTNLLYQIENGLRKGHSEPEVIEAVIRAISPGLKIRDMLEIKTDLTLTQLKTILKGHYREDDTSDLYQKLINISQEQKESPQDFLFRAIELKDRLLYISRGKGEEHYGADLVKRKFLRSVGTGLLNDNIKFQITSLLDNPDVTDETLIERLNEAVNLEAERLNKLKRNNAKAPKINELLTPEGPGTGPQTTSARTKENTKAARAPPEVHALVTELKAEVAEVKQMVLASLNNKLQPTKRPTYNAGPRRRRGCRTCQNNGEGDNCTHCFKCGQSGHISRGCRAPRLLQGNDAGPLPWDQQ